MKFTSFQRGKRPSKTHGKLSSNCFRSLLQFAGPSLYKAIAHDEEVYPDPFTFDSFKFILGEESVSAEMTLSLDISIILAIFNLSKPVNGEGNKVEPKGKWHYFVSFHFWSLFDFTTCFPVIGL